MNRNMIIRGCCPIPKQAVPTLPSTRKHRGRNVLAAGLAYAGLCLATVASAKEIHSNGHGGGRWSETATWHGGALPTADDEAVIAARDTVLFDRDDMETVTCKRLILDPKSNLAFQSGQGKRTLTVNGPVETYGSLKMHAQANTDEMELRLASTVAAERVIKLERGGALLVLGRADLPEGRRNATISVSPSLVAKTSQTGELTAGARTMIDVQNARVDNIAILATGIDNTGVKPNERCNFSGNRFTGQARLNLSFCDTPSIVKNEFEPMVMLNRDMVGITVVSCPLADIKGNRILGAYATGISIVRTECSATGNTLENCIRGISWHGDHWYVPPVMLKQNTLRNCKNGLVLVAVAGSVEDTYIDGGALPISIQNAKVQLTSVVITNPQNSVLMNVPNSSVSLLNCNIRPDQINGANSKSGKSESPAVEAMAFLVVGLKGVVPPRTQIEVLTSKPAAPLAPGASDLNIRNSPAPVHTDGLTALPQTLTPLIVKSWQIEIDGKIIPAPEYTLRVLQPPTEASGKPRTLKTLKLEVTDSWFRLKPNDPKPTIEIQLP